MGSAGALAHKTGTARRTCGPSPFPRPDPTYLWSRSAWPPAAAGGVYRRCPQRWIPGASIAAGRPPRPGRMVGPTGWGGSGCNGKAQWQAGRARGRACVQGKPKPGSPYPKRCGQGNSKRYAAGPPTSMVSPTMLSRCSHEWTSSANGLTYLDATMDCGPIQGAASRGFMQLGALLEAPYAAIPTAQLHTHLRLPAIGRAASPAG